MVNKPSFEKPLLATNKYDDFKVLIATIPPMDILNGKMATSDYEILVMLLYRLNEMIKVTSDYTIFINEILEWVTNDGLETSVSEKLNLWLNDGTLENLINTTLFNKKLDKEDFELFKNDILPIMEGKVNVVDFNLFKSEYNTFKEKTSEDIESKLNTQLFEDFKENDLNEKNEIKKIVEKNKKDIFSLQKGAQQLIYKNNGIRNFMHRGLSHDFPENSHYAFDMAVFTGASGIETDLWMSSDKSFIISHDNSLNSMTDSTLLISETSSNVILDLNITKGKNISKVPTTKMMYFEQLLHTSLRGDVSVIAEIKPTNLTNSDLQILIDIIKNNNAQSRVALMSFDFNTIERIRELDFEIVVGLVLESPYFSQNICDTLLTLGNAFASVSYSSINDSVSNQALADLNNIPITHWTINDMPLCNTLYRKGIRSITSDRIKGSRPTKREMAFMINSNEIGKLSVNNEFMPEFATIWVDSYGDAILEYVSSPVVNQSGSASVRRSIVQVSMSASNPYGYEVRAKGERQNMVSLSLYKDGQKISFATIPENIYFNVLVSTWDFI